MVDRSVSFLSSYRLVSNVDYMLPKPKNISSMTHPTNRCTKKTNFSFSVIDATKRHLELS
jgi:hypothetical protein